MLIFRGLPGTNDPYVKIGTFDSKSAKLLKTVDRWSQANNKAVNVNAIDNGTHGSGGTKFTFHGKSLAWDITPTTFVVADYQALGKYLEMNLPTPYEVIIEVDHIHVEWDTRSGR